MQAATVARALLILHSWCQRAVILSGVPRKPTASLPALSSEVVEADLDDV